MDTIGTRLKKLREKSGKMQNQVADAMSEMFETVITPGMLSLWENDKSMPSLDHVKRIARYYNVTLDYLINGEIQVSDKVLIDKEMAAILEKLNSNEQFKLFIRKIKNLDDDGLIKLAKILDII